MTRSFVRVAWASIWYLVLTTAVGHAQAPSQAEQDKARYKKFVTLTFDNK